MNMLRNTKGSMGFIQSALGLAGIALVAFLTLETSSTTDDGFDRIEAMIVAQEAAAMSDK